MRPDSLLCQKNSSQPIFEHILHSNGCDVYYDCRSPSHFPEHTDPHIKIGVPFEGTSFQATWQTGSGQRQKQRVREGHVCILPANLPHEVTLESKQEAIIINFEPTFIEQIADELVGKNVEIIEQLAAHDPLIQQLGSDLRREFQQRTAVQILRRPPRLLYVESVIQVLANHLIRHYSANRVVFEDVNTKLPPQKLQQAIDYINVQLEQNVTLSELSDVVEMSQYRFARAFKQSVGLPPHQYLLLQRIERAKKLLIETQLPIADISYQLGFASQSHFAATFRRYTTVTPNLYRKEVRASF